MMTSIVRQQALTKLIQDLVVAGTELQECTLSNVSMDSRRVTPGTLFLCLAKDPHQRSKHLKQALETGAFAIVYDAEVQFTDYEVELLNNAVVSAYPVEQLSRQAGEIAARFYNHPSNDMPVVAITGTNGKTSVSQFVAQALESLGQSCGIIGTLGAGRLSDLELTGMTTPDPVTIQRLLADFKIEGCQYVVMEASSHALEQGRLNSIDINVAVLTNLTRDHLDYHQNMAAYAAAKELLFKAKSLTSAVINEQDSFGKQLIEKLSETIKVLSYSSVAKAELYAKDIVCHQEGLKFVASLTQSDFSVDVPLLGKFNIDNLLATIGVLNCLGFEAADIGNAVKHCHPVAGRMEAYGSIAQPTVVIDYAHTPDALEQALTSLRNHLPESGQLWCVFGCGGDRDKGKRSLMGNIAESLADIVVITDDNPRTEDHEAIVEDILSGCKQPEKVHVEFDRKQAITFAITHAAIDDIILVAGKGHEAYQEINEIKYPFSDAIIVNEALVSVEKSVSNVAGGH